jgi:hypothetical protein
MIVFARSRTLATLAALAATVALSTPGLTSEDDTTPDDFELRLDDDDQPPPALDEVPAPGVRSRRRWRVGALPMLSYRSDDGFGAGGSLSLSHVPHGEFPYRSQLRLRAMVTTLLVQRYELRAETFHLAGLPLRVKAAAGWYATNSRHFCGVGNGVTCSVDVAEQHARARGLVPGSDAYVDMTRRYYLVRFMEAYVDGEASYRWRAGALLVEPYVTTRGAWRLTGEVFERRPYPGSLYARMFPKGEEGLVLVPQLGVLLEGRDSPAQPRRGFVFEGAVRGASELWGSGWSYAGAFARVAGYFALPAAPDAVLAAGVSADVLAGDVPLEDLRVTGGLVERPVFGGPWIGRGVREGRYVGKLKVMPQVEVRHTVYRAYAWNRQLEAGWAPFVDVAWIGADWDDLAGGAHGDPHRGHPLRLLWTAGAGGRLVVDDRISLRFDVGISPFEERGLQFYTHVGNAL